MARTPSPISVLAEKRSAIAKKRKRVRTAADKARNLHDSLAAHPGHGLLNPWQIGCPVCEREQKLLSEHEHLRKNHTSVTYDLADAAEREHTKRLAGQKASVKVNKAKPNKTLQEVRDYCRKHRINTTKPKVSERIAEGLGKSSRTVSRALKIINKK